MSEIVVEKTLTGEYRLADNAINLDEWIRDGLDVYNLFVFMKPCLFQLLEAVGGSFRASGRKANDDRLHWRISFREENVGKLGDPDFDRVIVATLTEAGVEDPTAPPVAPPLPTYDREPRP